MKTPLTERRPTFAQGVLVAVVLAVAGSIAFTASGLLGIGAGIEPVIAVLTLAYVLYLLSRSTTRIGKWVVLAAWACITGMLWYLPVTALGFIAAQGLMIWLIRSLYFHSGLLSAGVDLFLIAAGGGAFFWAFLHTGSLLIALWCFFLVQALFPYVPNRINRFANADDGSTLPGSRFDDAHKTAEHLLRRLV